MNEVFNTAQQRFDGHVMLLIPAAALLFTLYMVFWRKNRKWIWGGGALTLFLVLLTFVLPLADHRHMQAMAAGDGVETVEGLIAMHKRETTRVFTGTSGGLGGRTHNYTTQTDEQFYIGGQWFAFQVNDYPSQATFTNSVDPPLPLADGTWAKASFVRDPWYNDEVRIVRLSIGPPDRSTLRPDASARSNDFATFWTGFAAAAAQGDEAGLRMRTRFPFLFSNVPLHAGQFGQVWQSIFAPAPIRQCLNLARPVRDGEAFSVSCGVYVYLFEKGATGWQFTSFTADPEAVQ